MNKSNNLELWLPHFGNELDRTAGRFLRGSVLGLTVVVRQQFGGGAGAFIRKFIELVGRFLAPGLLGDMPAEAGVGEQALGDLGGMRHGARLTVHKHGF
jgi:hypothetical protein